VAEDVSSGTYFSSFLERSAPPPAYRPGAQNTPRYLVPEPQSGQKSKCIHYKFSQSSLGGGGLRLAAPGCCSAYHLRCRERELRACE
jgi:hypothetical protein